MTEGEVRNIYGIKVTQIHKYTHTQTLTKLKFYTT